MPTPYRPVAARFWEKVAVRDNDDCWLWTSAVGKCRYGIFFLNQGKPRSVLAHRLAYELAVGEIPRGLHIRHRCDNRLCVNPNHLLPGTALDNKKDAVDRRRHAVGERNGGGGKLSELSVRRIKIIGRSLHGAVLADVCGVDKGTISAILTSKIWRHVQPWTRLV